MSKKKTLLEIKIHDGVSYKKHHHIGNSDTIYTETNEKALACFLGGYNQFGRKVDLREFVELNREFGELIIKLSNKLEAAEPF
jgi:hypothetical protein